MNSLDKEIKKIRNLKQNQGKSEEELISLATASLEKQEIIGSLTFAIDDEERKFAQNLLSKYLEESSLEKEAEKDTLRQLIDIQILIERIKKTLNVDYDKVNPFIPTQMLDKLMDLNKQALELKDKLKLTQSKEEKNSAVKVIDDLLERFHKWINKPENRSNYEFQCPKCAETFLLRQRLDKLTCEVKVHPWFIDGGILFNKEIFMDLDLGKISESQAARFLNATLDYIQWIRTNYPLAQDNSEETENEEDEN